MSLEKKQKKDGRRFFIYILLFFLTFMIVDAFFVYKAMTTHTGTVEREHGR